MENTTRERETALRALLKLQFGVAEVVNPLLEAARVCGYEDEYDMALRQLMGGGKKEKKRERGEERETEEDTKVSSDELLLALAVLTEEGDGVRGPDWYKALEEHAAVSMTKGGFYARIKVLAAEKKVLSRTEEKVCKLYGRDVKAKVTLYWEPHTLKRTNPKLYAELGGAL